MNVTFSTLKGNDLARVLRWGPGYTGGEDPLNLLRDVIDAEEIRLDRWTVVFHPEDKPDDAAQKAPSNATGKKKKVHQAQQPSQQNPHQTPAIPSNNQPQGHLRYAIVSCYFSVFLSLYLLLLILLSLSHATPAKTVLSIELKMAIRILRCTFNILPFSFLSFFLVRFWLIFIIPCETLSLNECHFLFIDKPP